MTQNMWVELDGWRANLRFSACHFIPNHPKCGKLHGHSYAVSIKIHGIKRNDFVIDFEDIKKAVANICDQLDHKVLIAEADDDVDVRTEPNKQEFLITVGKGKKRYIFPNDDVVLLPIRSLSAEDLCCYLIDKISEKLDTSNVTKISLRLDEGLGQGAGCVKSFIPT